jgi:hypothetical protein
LVKILGAYRAVIIVPLCLFIKVFIQKLQNIVIVFWHQIGRRATLAILLVERSIGSMLQEVFSDFVACSSRYSKHQGSVPHVRQ